MIINKIIIIMIKKKKKKEYINIENIYNKQKK